MPSVRDAALLALFAFAAGSRKRAGDVAALIASVHSGKDLDEKSVPDFAWGRNLDDLYGDRSKKYPPGWLDRPWGCHKYAAGQDHDWCVNPKSKGKGGDWLYQFFEVDSECGKCLCCSVPEAQAVPATMGKLTGATTSEKDVVTSNPQGTLELEFFCKAATNFTLSALVLITDGLADKVQLQTTGEKQMWPMGGEKDWSWAAPSKPLMASKGDNLLKIIGYHGNIKMTSLSMVNGGEHCQLGPKAEKPAPTKPPVKKKPKPLPEVPVDDAAPTEPAPKPEVAPEPEPAPEPAPVPKEIAPESPAPEPEQPKAPEVKAPASAKSGVSNNGIGVMLILGLSGTAVVVAIGLFAPSA